MTLKTFSFISQSMALTISKKVINDNSGLNLNTEGKKEENEIIQFKTNKEFSQDHEMLLEKEMKLKDTQMRRLQERVRTFVGIERELGT